jgi:hypothetical protein
LLANVLALFLAADPFAALDALILAVFFARGFAFPRFDLVTHTYPLSCSRVIPNHFENSPAKSAQCQRAWVWHLIRHSALADFREPSIDTLIWLCMYSSAKIQLSAKYRN